MADNHRRKHRKRALLHVARRQKRGGSGPTEEMSNDGDQDDDLLSVATTVSDNTTRHELIKSHSVLNVSISPRPLQNDTLDDSAINAERRKSVFQNLLAGPGGGVLIGKDELRTVLPNQTADVHVVSWNLNGMPCLDHSSLVDILDHGHNVDVYAIGVQETPPPGSGFRTNFVIMVQKVIGRAFVPFKMVHLGTQMLVIFVKKNLLWFCTRPSSTSFRVKRPNLLVGTYTRTKGAIAIVFNLFKTSLLFISCHLSYTTVSARVEDYWSILNNLQFSDYEMTGPSNGDPLARYDRVFWFGDLNFRIDGTRSTIEIMLDQMVVNRQLVDSSLLDTDQLTIAKKRGKIFCEFLEHNITFPPTYKYDVGTHILDTSSKQRPPAYTDRVLYRSKCQDEVVCREYSSVHNVCLSDHKPVYASFIVNITPGRDIGMGRRKIVSELPSHVLQIQSKAFKSDSESTPNTKSKLCAIS